MPFNNQKSGTGPTSRRRKVVRFLVGALLPAALACGDGGVAPRPLNVTIEADKVAASTGESISFLVEAQGPRLLGVTINYGDGATDQLSINSATATTVGFRHVYTAAGTYTVRATALDALAGSKETSVEVRIN
jgi:hypothetical protein